MIFQEKYYEKVKRLADFVASTWDPKLKWMWGQALLGYALDELDKENGSENYTAFLKAYCDHWAKVDPAVDQSDTAAPGLITYAMYKRCGDEEYKRLTDKVLHYIRYEPRLYLDCLNHLGCSKKGKIYPKSVWIDSVMMFSVFTSLYAKENGDKELIDFAARQPKQYADMMLDSKEHLWAHSYWVKSGRAYPKNNIFWGRGNGWVICAFPMILDNIGLNHKEAPKIIEIYNKTSDVGIISFNIDGVHPHDAATFFDEANICLRAGHHCAQLITKWLKCVGTLRASLYIYNNYEDIDRFVEVVKQTVDFFKQFQENNYE